MKITIEIDESRITRWGSFYFDCPAPNQLGCNNIQTPGFEWTPVTISDKSQWAIRITHNGGIKKLPPKEL